MKEKMRKKKILIIFLISLLMSLLLINIIIVSINRKYVLFTIISMFYLVTLVYLVKVLLTEVTVEENNKFHKLVELISDISEDTTFDGTLKNMYHSFRNYIPYSHIGIALIKDNGKTIEASYAISDVNLQNITAKLHGIKVNIYDTSLAYIIEKGKPRIINDLHSSIKNPDALYNKIILTAGIQSSITYPLKLYNKPVGVIFFSSIYRNIYTEEHIGFLQTLSNSIAISLNKNLFIEELLYAQILSLAKLAEARDEDTGEHLERMKEYSVKLSELLYEEQVFPELTIQLIKDIERFSPLHDIGKVAIRDSILLKPGKLTDIEFKEMQEHTVYGAEVLQKAEDNMIQKANKSIFRVGIEIALSHHEKWNGSGYPYQKSGDGIPLSARIVAVADVFDALTSKRPYKKAFSVDESLEIIVNGKGTHFDPRIIDCFLRHKDDFVKIYHKFHNKIDSE